MLSVAAGGRPHQDAVLVAEGEGVAVDLQLTDHRQRGARLAIEHLEQAAVPGLELAGVEGVVEAEQADAVAHAAEARRRCSPHALGGAIGADQAGVGTLQIQELAIEAVVDRVLHHGGIEHVVRVRGLVQKGTQFAGACLGLAGHGRA